MIIASDIHFRKVKSIALERLISACHTDPNKVLIIAGDLTQHGKVDEYQELAAILQRLITDGLRVVCCPGNHDLSYLLGYPPSVNRRRTSRYLNYIASLINSQDDILGFFGYDTVMQTGKNVIISLRSVHRRGRLLMGNRIMRSQIRWATEVLDKHGITGCTHDVHFVTHYSLWSLPGDLHRNIHRRKRLEQRILIPYRVKTYINGHNHRYDAANRETPCSGYSIFHIQAPALVNRVLGQKSGFVHWDPARPQDTLLVSV